MMAQTEYGDVFKVSLVCEEDDVREIRVKYFDTLPVAVGLTLLRNGLLFLAAEFGNQSVCVCV